MKQKIYINDTGKSEISGFIESAITSISKNVIEAKENRILITDKNIENSISNIINAKNEFDLVLKNNNIILNKEIYIIIRIDGTNISLDKPVQVTLDKSVLDKLNGVGSIIILLGDNNHCIKITTENLNLIINEYGILNIQLEKTEENTYNITFAGSNGETVEKLIKPIGFLLPALNEMATVLASYKDGSDNWGGQYDLANKAIEFSTQYSGKYEVLENNETINDIDNLTDNQKQAIRFMVSKGYFKLDGNKFRPEASLTRYDFTEALVRMFFALDRDVETSFSDVSKDSEYYIAVASAEKDSIVMGYEDGTFKGDINISKEQMIALCARALAEKKGYTYPENPEDYLYFADKEQISEWAKKDIALAVREGLIEGTGVMNPLADINRQDSAEVLYKLFMLLYETSPSEFIMSVSSSTDLDNINESNDNKKTVSVVAVSILIVAVVVIVAVFSIRKKKIKNL